MCRSFKRYRTSCKLHDWSHKQKQLAQEQRQAEAVAPRSRQGTQTPGDIAIEMVNFSDIQVRLTHKLLIVHNAHVDADRKPGEAGL